MFRNVSIILVSSLLLAGTAGCPRKGTPASNDDKAAPSRAKPLPKDPKRRAELFVRWLQRGAFDRLYAQFDSKMQSVTTAEKTRQAYAVMKNKAGDFQRIVGTLQEQREGYVIVRVTCRFERENVEIKVVTDKQGKIAGLFFVPAPPKPSTARDSYTAQAEAVADQLARGAFDKAVESFDATMTRVLPAKRLGMAWEAATAQLGPFKRRVGTLKSRHKQFQIIFVTCQFERDTLDVKVVFDPQGKVAGLFFLPAPGKYNPAPYTKAARFTQREVTVGQGAWQLPGTLTVPKDGAPHPAVVMVHGSGPNDRDESVGACKPFRDLAEGLSSRGIVVLRYDKRTMVHGRKLGDQITTKEETMLDALAAAELLRSTAGVDPKSIFMLGHSLGGNLAPRIAKLDQKGRIAGLIILAGSTRPFDQLVLAQHRYLLSSDGSLSKDDRARLKQLAQQAATFRSPRLSKATPRDRLPLGISGTYALDLRGYDPVAAAKGLSLPMLILQGGRDYQVTKEDFKGWKDGLAGRKNVTFRLFPLLNHLFVAGKGKSLPDEYGRPGHVAEEVVNQIANWIGRPR
jgi:dienelactone hydrolase